MLKKDFLERFSISEEITLIVSPISGLSGMNFYRNTSKTRTTVRVCILTAPGSKALGILLKKSFANGARTTPNTARSQKTIT